ncbi:MAG: hypothetical protein EBS89_05625 [Proteobacteria bacterium]|jgi:protein-arginine kinase activator protein McsA|nr:hypothetical protein [Pseudomonadota bacterium]
MEVTPMMFTAARTTLGKLRALEGELAQHYADAITRRRFDEAAAIRDRRRAVRRAVLLAEEFGGELPHAAVQPATQAA